MQYHYRGVAIFGAPGSGKTTIAKSLIGLLPKSPHIEASRSVMMPAFSIRDRLPKREADFTKAIAEASSRTSTVAPSRDEARAFFAHLTQKYSPAVVAKALDEIHRKKFAKRFVIVAGARGYANAAYLKKNGYLLVYLKAPAKHLAKRVAKRESFSLKDAERERDIEQRLFSTDLIENIADLSFDTADLSPDEITRKIHALAVVTECKRCLNSSASVAITIMPSGLCAICDQYEKNFDKRRLDSELKLLRSLIGSGKKKYDAMVGISGGKDSTATLYETQRLGFHPLSFSLNTGYYPKHIFQRAKEVAKKLHVDYQEIDARSYIRPADTASFRKTAELYDEKNSEALKEKFRRWYAEGRRHYSVKCRHAIPFVRTCQLCRRIIVRSYYGEAQKHGVQVVILGINEWAGLSQDAASKKITFKAIRKLQPFKNKPSVYIVHLPFLLQHTIGDTRKILARLGWKIPAGEALIESNANSCLFARAAETKARTLLGFHPDTTRLSREVTVGFITKTQARKALAKIHTYPHSVKTVLEKAHVLERLRKRKH